MRLILEILLILISPAFTLSFSWQSACFAGSTNAPRRVKRARAQRTRVYAAPSSGPGSFSFVEGSEFENSEDEILAMGGDPFFLQGDDDDGPESGTNLQMAPERDTETNEKVEPYTAATDDWKSWDGEVDEEAHFDLY